MFLGATVALAFVLAGCRVHAAEDAGKVYQECIDYLKAQYSDLLMNRCCNWFRLHDEMAHVKHGGNECQFPSPGEELKCEDSECWLRKGGIISANSKIDYTKAASLYEMFSKISPQVKEIMDLVGKTCTEQNINLLSNTDCPAFDYQACTLFAGLGSCTAWDEKNEKCKAIIEKSKTCKAAIDKMVAKKQ